jgi:hypothetical protein
MFQLESSREGENIVRVLLRPRKCLFICCLNLWMIDFLESVIDRSFVSASLTNIVVTLNLWMIDFLEWTSIHCVRNQPFSLSVMNFWKVNRLVTRLC